MQRKKENNSDNYKKISPMKAIRLKCIDCCGGILIEVKACSSLKCPLWKYRLGLHPNTEKNQDNVFLQAKNFKGLENKEASEVIQYIEFFGETI